MTIKIKKCTCAPTELSDSTNQDEHELNIPIKIPLSLSTRRQPDRPPVKKCRVITAFVNRSATDSRSDHRPKRKKSLTSGARAFPSPMATPNAPPPEAVDLVAYLNEAWTPYHAVLASCKRLMAAGFEASPRARPSFPHLESPNDFSSHPEAGRVRAGGARVLVFQGDERRLRRRDGSGAVRHSTTRVEHTRCLPLTPLIPRSQKRLHHDDDDRRSPSATRGETLCDRVASISSPGTCPRCVRSRSVKNTPPGRGS